VFAIGKSQFIFINGIRRRMAITSGCLARFDSASVVGMDVDVNLALFDPLGDDGPIVVVFLHIVDHQNK